MVTRVTQLNSGGTLTVRESILRGSGPIGPEGPRGDTGLSVKVRGWKETKAEIDLMSNTTGLLSGDAWYAQDTKYLYVWYRYDDELPAGQWYEFGKVQGVPGYLNSVGAKLVTSTQDATMSVLRNTTVRLKFKQSYVDGEWVDGQSQQIPIIEMLAGTPASNAVAVDNFEMIRTKIPATVYTTDYPESTHLASYLVVATADFTPSTPNRGQFQLQIVARDDQGGETIVSSATTYTYDKTQTVTVVTLIQGSDHYYEVRGYAIDTDGLVSTRKLELIRAGGGPGPQGPQGVQGLPMRVSSHSPVDFETDVAETPGELGEILLVDDTGMLYVYQEITEGVNGWAPLGVVRGIAGDANSGFNFFDGLIGTGVSTDPETDVEDVTLLTADQQIPLPDHDAEPRVPYWLRRITEFIESRLVGRYLTTNIRDTSRDAPVQGQLAWSGSGTDATRGLALYTGDNGSGREPYVTVATVIVSTSDAPASGVTYPDGTLWVKV